MLMSRTGPSLYVITNSHKKIMQLLKVAYHKLIGCFKNLYKLLPLQNPVSTTRINLVSVSMEGLPDKIETVIFDFDGVFTNNKVYVDQNGIESVVCDRSDGLGIKMLREYGIPMFILSTETNPVVESRAKKLDLPVEYGCTDKKQFLLKYFELENIDPNNSIYVGNDLNDLEAMKLVGYSVAPADAHYLIISHVDHVLRDNGGCGAIREFSELLINHIKGE